MLWWLIGIVVVLIIIWIIRKVNSYEESEGKSFGRRLLDACCTHRT